MSMHETHKMHHIGKVINIIEIQINPMEKRNLPAAFASLFHSLSPYPLYTLNTCSMF